MHAENQNECRKKVAAESALQVETVVLVEVRQRLRAAQELSTSEAEKTRLASNGRTQALDAVSVLQSRLREAGDLMRIHDELKHKSMAGQITAAEQRGTLERDALPKQLDEMRSEATVLGLKILHTSMFSSESILCRPIVVSPFLWASEE